MAGEIFVGSVAVSVVPDLRGFNDRTRAELVPAANDIGKEIGSQIAAGILENLDFGAIFRAARDKSLVSIKATGRELGLEYGASIRSGIEDSLKDIHASVKLDVDKSTLSNLRADITGDVTGGVLGGRIPLTPSGKLPVDIFESKLVRINEQLDVLSRLLAIGPITSRVSRAGRAGAVTVGGGIQSLIDNILGGGTGGESSSVVKNAVEAAAADEVAKEISGSGKGGGGGGGGSDRGWGIAFGTILSALRPGGNTPITGIGQAFGQLPEGVAGPVGGVGAGVVAAALPFIGQQLGSGIIGLAGTALAGLGIAGATGLGATTKTAGQAAVSAQFAQLSKDAQGSLAQIGVAFIPVMSSIISTANNAMGKLTPIFAGAERVIAGPFKNFADIVINSFTSPQVAQSIQAVARAFGGILNALAPDIPGIINSFADAITRIANAVAKNPKAFADFIDFLAQIPILLLNVVAFLTNVADYIEFHFTPAVQHFVNFWIDVGHEIEHAWDVVWTNTVVRTEKGLHDVASAFDAGRHETSARWDQTGKDIANIWNSFWTNVVARTAHGVLDVIHTAERIYGVLNTWDHLNSQSARLWNWLWSATIGWAITGTQQTIGVIVRFVNLIISHWHDVQHWSDLIWNQIWNNTVSQVVNGYNRMSPVFHTIRNMVVGWWNDIMHWSSILWNQIWSNTIGQAIRGVSSLIGIFNTIRPKIVNALSSAGSWLFNVGISIIEGMMNGIDSAMRGIAGWVNAHVVQPVIHAVKYFFGIHSPASVMLPIGENVMQGVLQGMLSGGANLAGFMGKVFGGWPQALGALVSKSLVDITKLPAKALNALGGLVSKVGGFFARIIGGGSGGGVNQWAGTVMQALAMLHLPFGLLGQVLYQMQTESGGNVNAINLSDINAKMGDPSRGLMQVIGSTFSAYHVPGTSGNIYDPLANIAAALNYAVHVYGPSLMSHGMGIGSGHGYDMGGYAPPGASWFWNGTGRPEPVLTDSQWNAIYSAASGSDGAVQYHAHFDGLTGAAIESHVQTAFRAMSLTQGALSRHGRRS